MSSREELLLKFRENKCNKEEIAVLMQFFAEDKHQDSLKTAIDSALMADYQEDDHTSDIVAEVFANLSGHITAAENSRIISTVPDSRDGKPKPYLLWQKIAAAAIVLIMLSAGLYFYRNLNTASDFQQGLAKNDLPAGSNKASLTLANGKVIDLGKAGNGQLISQNGLVISKAKSGQLVYTVSAVENQDPAALNIISTPRGGQYQLNLPDGTKIWLNASSSLKFPQTFAGLKERKVQLTGEAYFEVAKNKKMPFKVFGGRQLVTVLGTHFNINSYPDEPAVRTTLLEGSVKVSLDPTAKNAVSKVIIPGQQSVSTASGIAVAAADLDEVMAWQKGEFMFNNQTLKQIMANISRWYDVEIVYEKEQDKYQLFSGSISRFNKVSKVLRMLELTGHVKFKLEGRRITVIK